MKFRFVFWDVLPCKIFVERRVRGTPCCWSQHVPLRRPSTIILHGSTSQKTNLNLSLGRFLKKLIKQEIVSCKTYKLLKEQHSLHIFTLHQRAYCSSCRWYMSIESHGGIILTGGNRRTRRETCPSATSSTTNPTWTDPGAKPDFRRWDRRLTTWAMARPKLEVTKQHWRD
jgi:hypothetical protein